MVQTSGSYSADYEKIRQLETDIEVLEKKFSDYTRIEKGIGVEFDKAVKEMAALEIEADSLIKLSFKKIGLKITRKYDDAYYKNMYAREEKQRELDNIKFRTSDIRGKLKDTRERLDKMKLEYNKQREYMRATYTQFNQYEKELEAERDKLRAILKEIDEAIRAVDEVQGMVNMATEKFESARNWGFADMLFDDSIICQVVKYNQIDSAESIVYSINAAVQRMNKELKDVNNVYGVYCQQFGSDMKFMDFFFDNVFMDWAVIDRIEQNLNSLNNFSNKLRDIENTLIGNRNEVQRELSKNG